MGFFGISLVCPDILHYEWKCEIWERKHVKLYDKKSSHTFLFNLVKIKYSLNFNNWFDPVEHVWYQTEPKAWQKHSYRVCNRNKQFSQEDNLTRSQPQRKIILQEDMLKEKVKIESIASGKWWSIYLSFSVTPFDMNMLSSLICVIYGCK